MGKLLFSTVGGGVDEGAGVGTTGPLVELQAVTINNPNKPLNTSINFFFIIKSPILIDPSKNSTVKNIIAPITMNVIYQVIADEISWRVT